MSCGGLRGLSPGIQEKVIISDEWPAEDLQHPRGGRWVRWLWSIPCSPESVGTRRGFPSPFKSFSKPSFYLLASPYYPWSSWLLRQVRSMCVQAAPAAPRRASRKQGLVWGVGAGVTDKKLASYGSRICFLREPEILFHSGRPFKDDPQVSLC